MTTTAKSTIDDLSFEQAMAELESIVRGLESGDIELEASIEAYERGAALKKHCEKKLAGAKARIEKITVGSNGTIKAESAEIE
ncbi:MAG: exodeoxyribonuclease VII small subunit [Rhodospirillales bacterium]|jgi:exodeoxyribonuclease VII small subunit|uniref:exodeoxyribonuclease VII small subunit n=1 Tax=Hwanghaeella sp. 1Z406 TaxID=3402811 RepID=UPI000C8EF95E|nr:exodeoxyribonuclease VII small subunit [Rhodospirillales bacterium]|tara:strand:- start:53912 stop:54160 length:249 start_codon:yes stop_codon:yes gene_type:complete